MLTFIKEVAREAGRTAMHYFDGTIPNEIHTKATPKDMVSAADLAVEKLIIDRIRKKFPEDCIFGEESGKSGMLEKNTWVIDPIDGTQSFIKHHPFFSISIAYCEGAHTTSGVVYAPALGLLFAAERGSGARLNDEPIHVSSCSTLEEAACETGFGCIRIGRKVNNLKYFSKIVPHLRDIKRGGSAALSLSLTAAGTYDAYWEMGLQPYDVAAGALIAEEAGAMVRDLHGGCRYPEEGIIAANPELLAKFLPFFHDLPENPC